MTITLIGDFNGTKIDLSGNYIEEVDANVFQNVLRRMTSHQSDPKKDGKIHFGGFEDNGGSIY